MTKVETIIEVTRVALDDLALTIKATYGFLDNVEEWAEEGTLSDESIKDLEETASLIEQLFLTQEQH